MMQTKIRTSIQILIIITIALQVSTWVINLLNIGIAYNKYERTLMMQEGRIKASSDLKYLRQQALNSIAEIRTNDAQKHKVTGLILVALSLQVLCVLSILILSFFLPTNIVRSKEVFHKTFVVKLFHNALVIMVILGLLFYAGYRASLLTPSASYIWELLIHLSMFMLILVLSLSIYLNWVKKIYWFSKIINAIIIFLLVSGGSLVLMFWILE